MIIKNRTFFISDHVSDYYKQKFAREILERGGLLTVNEKDTADCVVFDAEKQYTGTSIKDRNDHTLYVTVNEMIRFFDASPLYKGIEFIVKNGVLLKWIPEESQGKKLVIPDGVKTIPSDAFAPTYPCQEPLFRKARKGITEIIFPKTLEVIKKDAFRSFTDLLTLDFKEGIRELSGFRGCRSLESFSIPESCEIIGDYAFAGCKSLKGFDGGWNVKKIGRSAFNATALNSFEAWDALKEIGDYAFANTLRLTGLTLVCERIRCGKYAFRNSGVYRLTVTSKNCTFGNKCFENCNRLWHMNLGGSVHITPSSFPVYVIEDGLKLLSDPSAVGTCESMMREMMQRYKSRFLKMIPADLYLKYQEVIDRVLEDGKNHAGKRDPVKMEAVARLRSLERQVHLNPNVRKYYLEGKLYYSYMTGGGFIGSIDTISYNPRYEKIVKDAEERFGFHVYHCVESLAPWHSLTLLYVEKDPSEWYLGRPEEGDVYGYVHNFELGEGEFGYVAFEAYQGALYRVR